MAKIREIDPNRIPFTFNIVKLTLPWITFLPAFFLSLPVRIHSLFGKISNIPAYLIGCFNSLIHFYYFPH